jgi:hypothetical protein
MTSYRNKRYQQNVESPDKDGPVMAAPISPDVPAVAPAPSTNGAGASPAESNDPGKEASRRAIALQLRLQEMERAEASREAANRAQPAIEEQEQQQPQQQMPARVEKWLAEHPQYCNPNDHVAQAEIHLATVKCMRDGKTWHDPDFIDTVERHLGMRQPQPNGNGSTAPAPAPRAAPVVRQRQSGGPVSAPPSREIHSLTTGKPTTRLPPLTADEVLIARASARPGMTDAEALREYSFNKQKMLALKARGEIQNG